MTVEKGARKELYALRKQMKFYIILSYKRNILLNIDRDLSQCAFFKYDINT